jgi:hypothetical protein
VLDLSSDFVRPSPEEPVSEVPANVPPKKANWLTPWLGFGCLVAAGIMVVVAWHSTAGLHGHHQQSGLPVLHTGSVLTWPKLTAEEAYDLGDAAFWGYGFYETVVSADAACSVKPFQSLEFGAWSGAYNPTDGSAFYKVTVLGQAADPHFGFLISEHFEGMCGDVTAFITRRNLAAMEQSAIQETKIVATARAAKTGTWKKKSEYFKQQVASVLPF